ncbi:WD repeat domain 74 lethal (2) k09848 isoform X1 [Xylocopa sonorina]|uniref:WD repeat domain 74 lethal (2) k09848 isoform X1 n=2 Tax=Xylocopa sonorina TaxID=1818115 RepID=UPI00403B2768
MTQKDDFNIYVGAKSGVFKGIKIGKDESVMHNIQNLVSITNNDEVTSMSWGNDEENEVLLACGAKAVRSVKVYDTDCSMFTCSFICNVGTGKINGISRCGEAILTAVHSGEVKLWRFKEEDGFVIKAGENLERMRHSKINKRIIATGGREHKLKIFDIERQTQMFVEKNLPHDWLQLRVPIWISDIEFLPNTEQVVTVGRYGHVRLYDPNVQRRPVINLEIKDEALTTLCTVPREKQIIVGSGKGRMNLVDLRNPGKVLNTYKGFVGGVTAIACSKSEPYVVSISLDRHLRIHHIDTKELLKKVYLTSKMTCMLLRSEFSLPVNKVIDAENTKSRNDTISEDVEIDTQKDTQIHPDSDPEYDTLFDTMQVIGNKEDSKLIGIKRRKLNHSTLYNEIVSNFAIFSFHFKSL